jgi:hypothetical protein
MPATQTAPRRTRKSRQTSARPVPELLLELAYRLHATRVVARPTRPEADWAVLRDPGSGRAPRPSGVR